MGKIPGPVMNGLPTFCVVLGLFNSDGAQIVHTYDDGSERPIVIVSNPMPQVAAKNGLVLQ